MTWRSPWNLAAWSMMPMAQQRKIRHQAEHGSFLSKAILVLGRPLASRRLQVNGRAHLCKVKPCCPAQMPQSFPDTALMRIPMAMVLLAGLGCGIAAAQPAPNAAANAAAGPRRPFRCRCRARVRNWPRCRPGSRRCGTSRRRFPRSSRCGFQGADEVTSEMSPCRARGWRSPRSSPRCRGRSGPGACGGGDIVRLVCRADLQAAKKSSISGRRPTSVARWPERDRAVGARDDMMRPQGARRPAPA